jgi:hypothetical protein
MLKEYLQKRKVRKLFGQYIPSEKIDAILREDGISSNLEENEIDVIIAMTGGETPESISSRMGEIAEVGIEYDAVVDHLIPPFVILVYGVLPFSSCDQKTPEKLIEALLKKFQNEIKVVYLRGRGKYGNIGGPSRFSYTFIMPQFTSALSSILSLPFGQVKVIKA